MLIDTGEQLGAVLVWLGGIVLVVVMAARYVRVVAAPFMKAHQSLRRWVGGIVDDRLNYRNDGESMRDQIDRLEIHASQQARDIEGMRETRGELRESVERIHERIDDLFASMLKR